MAITRSWKTLLLLSSLIATQCTSSEVRWDHSVDLDENFRLQWKVKEPDIIFEVQVKTHGYVGFGFTRSEYIYGADMVVGWVDNKHTFFQVSFNPNQFQLRNFDMVFYEGTVCNLDWMFIVKCFLQKTKRGKSYTIRYRQNS